MVNIREYIAVGLKTIIDNVKMTRPDGDIKLPLICYAETDNTPIDMGHVRLKYRVAVYASTFEDLVNYVDQVDELMSNRYGFTRQKTSPDGDARIGTDLYLMRLDYSCKYSLVLNMILREN